MTLVVVRRLRAKLAVDARVVLREPASVGIRRVDRLDRHAEGETQLWRAVVDVQLLEALARPSWRFLLPSGGIGSDAREIGPQRICDEGGEMPGEPLREVLLLRSLGLDPRPQPGRLKSVADRPNRNAIVS